VLVGHWNDLAAYYYGDDENYWSWNQQSGWVNLGSELKNKRGWFLSGAPIGGES